MSNIEDLEKILGKFNVEGIEKSIDKVKDRMARRQFGKKPSKEELEQQKQKQKEQYLKNRDEMEGLHFKCVICEKAISKETILDNAYTINNLGRPSANLDYIDEFIKVCSNECRKRAIYDIYPSDEKLISVCRMDGVYIDFDNTECNIPEALRKFSKKFYPREFQLKIEAWILNLESSKSKWLNGLPGCGKTGLAISHIVEAKRREKSSYFIKFFELSEELNRAKLGYSENIIKKYTKYDLLVIDDISQLFLTDYAKSILFTILNILYENNKKIIITSNYSLEEIAEWIDGRLISRLKNYLEVISMGEVDLRSI